MSSRNTVQHGPTVAALALFLPVLANCSGTTSPRSTPRPRNLVLMVLDTLRPDHLGCYGCARPTSPHIDALASDGYVFENAQSSAPWTAPALISLMTSLDPDVHQVRDFPHPARMVEDVTTLAEVLKKNGLETAAITEGGFAKGDFGLDQGFDLYWKNQGDEEGDNAHMRLGSRLERNAGEAVEWLREHHEKPFFLFFHTYEPHTPYDPKPEHLQAVLPSYDAEAERAALRVAIETWRSGGKLNDKQWLDIARHGHDRELMLADAGEADRAEELWKDLVREGFGSRGGARAHELYPFLKALYDAEIRYADEQFDRILKVLAELGHSEDTLVIITSDHGEAFGEHGQLGHGRQLYDEVLRIVLVMHFAGLQGARSRVPDLVRQVDVMPTVLDLFGIPFTDLPIQGRSLVPVLWGEAEPLPCFSHSTAHVQKEAHLWSVRTPRWRHIAGDQEGERWLYDLTEDPAELRNVSDLHPDVVESLGNLLREQRRSDEALRRSYKGELVRPGLDQEALEELRRLGYLDSDE